MLIRKRTLFVFCLLMSFVFGGLPISTSRADTFRPVVRGKRGVIAGGQPLSVEAGLRILQRGGNAVDAGVATTLAASVIEFSHFSFGGEVPILIKLKGQKVVVIEGMGQAPMKATREFFVNRQKSASITDFRLDHDAEREERRTHTVNRPLISNSSGCSRRLCDCAR